MKKKKKNGKCGGKRAYKNKTNTNAIIKIIIIITTSAMICPSHKPRTSKIIFRFLSQDIVRCISDCGLCVCVWTLCRLPHVIILGDYLLQRFSPVPFQYVATLDQILIFVRVCLCVSGKSLCMLLVHTHGMHARQTSQKRNKMGKIDFIYGLDLLYACVYRHDIESIGGVVMFMKSVDIVFVHTYTWHESTYQAYWYQSSILVLNVQC